MLTDVFSQKHREQKFLLFSSPRFFAEIRIWSKFICIPMWGLLQYVVNPQHAYWQRRHRKSTIKCIESYFYWKHPKTLSIQGPIGVYYLIFRIIRYLYRTIHYIFLRNLNKNIWGNLSKLNLLWLYSLNSYMIFLFFLTRHIMYVL